MTVAVVALAVLGAAGAGSVSAAVGEKTSASGATATILGPLTTCCGEIP